MIRTALLQRCKLYMRLLFETFHKSTYIRTNIGFVFVNAKLLSDFMAYDIMAFRLDVFSYFLATQSYCIQAEVIDFVSRQFMLFEILHKLWVRRRESKACGVHKLLFVITYSINPFVVRLCIAVVIGYLFCQQTVEQIKPALYHVFDWFCQFRLFLLQFLQIVTLIFQLVNF